MSRRAVLQLRPDSLLGRTRASTYIAQTR
ncbi:MAG: hypothetical protein QOJ51_3148, partial [Acidobacteriaceae bacterium]|nr:hypothetical protein [Acidobacteriaceae bacterium]